MTRPPLLGLLALSLLSSATWFVGDLLPLEGPPLAGEGLRLLLCAAVTFCFIVPRAARDSAWQGLRVAAASLGVIALPSVLLNAARGRIASTAGVLVFALMPVATMLIGGGWGREADGLRVLPSAMLGVAGVMLLLPVRLPAGTDGLLGACLLVAAMLLTAASMIWSHRLLRGLSLRAALPLVCLLNGLVLCVAGGFTGWGLHLSMFWPHALRAILFDLPRSVLLVWLLHAITPQRLAARYLIAPLFTVVEGLFLIRPHLDLRTLAGLGLLIAGVGIMLFGADPAKPDRPGLSLR